MVSPELIRRYPIFSGMSETELKVLAESGHEAAYEKGTVLFRRNDRLDAFFLVVEGEIEILVDMTARDVVHDLSAQLTGDVETEDIVVSTVIPGQVCSWSALIPPFTATGAARASDDTTVIEFNAFELLEAFDENPTLGYKITQKLAQVIQERLQDRRMELLSQFVNHGH